MCLVNLAACANLTAEDHLQISVIVRLKGYKRRGDESPHNPLTESQQQRSKLLGSPAKAFSSLPMMFTLSLVALAVIAVAGTWIDLRISNPLT